MFKFTMKLDQKESIINYFDQKLLQYGPQAKGVDWNSEESQKLRFEQFVRLLPSELNFSILDYGCGYGALLKYLREKGFSGSLQGYDFSKLMIKEAESLGDPKVFWTSDAAQLTPADFTLASGIFNLKLNVQDDLWKQYIFETLFTFDALSVRGFCCNFLTSYSDLHKQRRDLYYANPLEIFDFCKRKLSRFVTLVHDYPLYEFTVLVRKE